MASMYAKNARLKDFLRYFFRKYQPKCVFCKEPLDWKSFFRNMNGNDNDGTTIHHLDGNHFNDEIDNQELSHRKCHLKYHRQKEIDEAKERYLKGLKIRV